MKHRTFAQLHLFDSSTLRHTMLYLRLTLVTCCFLFTESVLLAQCPITVNAGEDVYVCAPPTPVELNGEISGDYMNFNWSPTVGMMGANSLSPTVTVTQTTNYVLTARAMDLDNNLVSNGDFEGGAAGFDSDYVLNPGNLVPEGLYDVIDNPQLDHPGFAPCDDHTSGTGNMMVVNGAGTPNQNVWCQTVNVTPNSQYVLSAWVTSVVAGSPALLQFSINGGTLGGIFQAPGGTCAWQNYFQIWNSGANTSATICIVNQNTTLGGNDFALDDIVFSPLCTVTDTVKVVVINVMAAAAPAQVILPCEGAIAQLSGAGSSVGPNISYEWSTAGGNIVSGGNTLTPTINAPGEYTISVSYSINGEVYCTKTATVNVIDNPNPIEAWITPPLPLGCGSPTTTLIGNSSQSALSTYQWTTTNGNIVGNPNVKNCVVNQVGTYTLLVTNVSTGCTATASVAVGLTNNVPTAAANSNGIITCVNDTVPLLGAGSSFGPGITYSWTTIIGQISGPTNTLNTTASAGGLYILHVTNTSNNCTSNDTVTVPANITPPSVVGTLPPQLSCDPNQDTISLLIFVGPPPFVLINWTTSNGFIVSGQFTPAPQANQPGTYTVSVFDPANGCYNFDTSQVTANFTIPMADILPADTVTCQSPSILLQGSGSTVGANFSINWTASNGGNIVSGGNTLTPTVNSAGDYLLILRDSVSLCADTAMISVSADTNIVVAVANAPDTLNCLVNTVSLNNLGSSNGGNLSYAWTTTNGNITGGQNTPNPTVNAPGTYQLQMTNQANGCSAIDLAIVEQNTAAPPISINPPDTLTCAVQSQTIQAQNANLTGSFSYLWAASNGGNITSGGSTLSPNINQAGTYTLTATNLTTGCSSSASVNVILENGFPVITTAVPGPLTCVASSQILNTLGSSTGPNYQYQWSTLDGNISAGANTPNPTVTAPGSYTLQITNTANGCAASSTVAVLQDTLAPGIAIQTPPDTLTCLSTQLELIGNGTGNAVWSSTTGNILFTTGFSAQIDAPGQYILTTTDPNNGCVSVDSVEIFENVLVPSLSVAPPVTLTCLVNSVSLNATSASQNLQFDWQTSNGNIVSGQNASSSTVDEAGDYVLIVTDGQNGCSNTTTVNVPQDTLAPNIAVNPPATLTCDLPTITLQGQNLSLPGTFTYNWTASGGANIVSGANTLTPTLDIGGAVVFACFNVTNGCESMVTVNVPQNTNLPSANAGPDNTLSCLTNSLTINGSGSGAATLDYLWQASNGGNIVSGGTTPTPVINQAGIYTLTVENPINGCISTDVVEIFQDANAPLANAGTSATLTCAILQTNLNGTGSAGPNISYNWTAGSGGIIQSGQTTLTPTVTEPGVYTLAVSNSTNGCVTTSSVTVPENVTPPIVEAGISATLTCALNSVNLSGTSSGGTATYAWTTSNGTIVSGGTTLTPTVSQTGTYTLSATLSSNGCSANDVVTVGIDTLAPAFQINTPLLLTCSQLNTPLGAIVQQPAAGNYTASWSTSNGQLSADPNQLSTEANAPGVYVLNLVSALNGCDAQLQVTVNQDTVAPTALAAQGGNLTCTLQNLNLSGAGSSTGNNFSYLWTASNGGTILSNGTSLSPNVGSVGTYTLQVSNSSNGCTSSTSTTVGSNTNPPTAAIVTPAQITCLQNTVTLDGSSSSPGPNFTAGWSTTNGTILSGQNTFTATVSEAGIYVLTVLDQQNGCTTIAQTQVIENTNTPGALILPADPLNCNTPQINLIGSSPTLGALTYSWTTTNGGNLVNGSSSTTPLVDEPGTYTLQITNPANGCSSSTSLNLQQIPEPNFEPTLTQPNCLLPTGTVNFGTVSGGQAPFQYSLDGGTTYGPEAIINGLHQATYELVVIDAIGCTVMETVDIEEPFLASLDIDAIIKIDQGDSIQLAPLTNIPANQIVSWEWSPATGLSCTDCQEPWAKPFYSQYYDIRVEDQNGCFAEDRILVQVSRKRHIYPPTAFTPNEDGDNDRFTLYAKGVREIRRLAIFDRWGEEVFFQKNFQPNDESMGWDGSFRGTPLNPAVFVWTAEVEYIDGEVEIIYGDVTVVR